VLVQGCLYVLEGKLGGTQPVLLLDTALPENAPEDRKITNYLYGDDKAYRLKQEIDLRTAPGFAGLYDEYVRGWCHEPELLVCADQIPDEQLWQAHLSAKETLFGTIEARTGARLDRALPLLGFARRMTGYKRPDLLFSDLERLKRIARKFPFQVVLSGRRILRTRKASA
jgi:glucan phosphorylase